jgi:hypothetical protein
MKKMMILIALAVITSNVMSQQWVKEAEGIWAWVQSDTGASYVIMCFDNHDDAIASDSIIVSKMLVTHNPPVSVSYNAVDNYLKAALNAVKRATGTTASGYSRIVLVKKDGTLDGDLYKFIIDNSGFVVVSKLTSRNDIGKITR